MSLKVGDPVWLFDGNHRVYRDGASGPVYREHFIRYVITGETRTSWLIRDAYKIDKSTGLLRPPSRDGYFGLSPFVRTSQSQVDDACWIDENRRRIVKLVVDCVNVPLLQQIERMVMHPENQ